MPKLSTKKRTDGLVIISEEQSLLPDIYRPDDRDLRILLDRAVTESDWVALFQKAKDMAFSGGQTGIKAMEFLAKYRFGLPAQMTAPQSDRQVPITVIEVMRGLPVGKEEQIEPSPKLEDKVEEVAEVKQEDSVPF